MAAEFPWTRRSLTAARLLAEDELSDAAIAEQVGVAPRTLARWKTDSRFTARVSSHVEAWKTRIRQQGIAVRERRIKALNDRELLMARVIAERAGHADFKDIPGGTTGLLVRSWKVAGDTAYPEFAVDTGLLAELRAHEKQAAQELGQWVEKGEIRGSREAPLVVEHIGAAELVRAERAFLAELGLEPGGLGDVARDDHPPDAGPDPV